MQICRMTPGGATFLLLCCSLTCLLLDHLSLGSILASVGTDVSLTCNYNAQKYGRLSCCWGRGPIPSRGCAKEVIKSNGASVISRQSERYLLLGDLAQGDVSLTIRQVEESDSGIYGCRVDIPGWFNDHKHEQKLTVVPVHPSPMKVEVIEVKERTVTLQWSSVFNGGRPITSYWVDIKKEKESWTDAALTKIHNPALHQVTLMELHPAKTYNIRMFAHNIIGMSDSSNVLTITTNEAVPEGRPQDLKLEALSSRSIKVTWKPPTAELRNGVLRNYIVSYRKINKGSQHASPLVHKTIPVTLEKQSLILADLMPSTQYSVLIRTTTNVGAGPYAVALCSTLDEVPTTTEAATFSTLSTTSTKVTPHITSSIPEEIWTTGPEETSTTESKQSTRPVDADFTTEAAEPGSTSAEFEQSTDSVVPGAPDPPVLQLSEVTSNTVSLFWAPGLEGDSPVTGFILTYKTENASWDSTIDSIEFSPDLLETTLVEFHPSTYQFRVFARSRHGVSKPSNVLTVTTAQTGQENNTVATNETGDSQVATVVEGNQINHFAAVLPAVLVVLLVAAVTTWQIRRVKYKQGKLNFWMSNRAPQHSISESQLQEL